MRSLLSNACIFGNDQYSLKIKANINPFGPIKTFPDVINGY